MEARFFNPNDRSTGKWDYGFYFRYNNTSGEIAYLAIDSDGNWKLSLFPSNTYSTGKVPKFDTSATGSNTLSLYASGERAYFFVNEVYTATFDLSKNMMSGGIGIGTGIYKGFSTVGKTTRIDGFVVFVVYGAASDPAPSATSAVIPATVRPTQLSATGLPPATNGPLSLSVPTPMAGAAARATTDAQSHRSSIIYGPESGQFQHFPGSYSGASFRSSKVNLRDFIVEARFYNPYDPSVGNWDYGFIFRDTQTGIAFRVSVNADKTWRLLLEPSNRTATGMVANLDVSASGYNALYLFVDGGVGLFYVNGTFIATFDLSGNMASGDVAVGIGFSPGVEVAGKTTRYDSFIIYKPTEQAQARAIADAQSQKSTVKFRSDKGQISHDSEAIALHPAGVQLSDFIAETRLANPTAQIWSYGFVFRLNRSTAEGFYLSVHSDKTWQLEMRSSLVAVGVVENLDISATGHNTLHLFVNGGSALFFVNGVYIATLNVGGYMAPGDVGLGAGFSKTPYVQSPHLGDKWTLPYENFIVYAP